MLGFQWHILAYLAFVQLNVSTNNASEKYPKADVRSRKLFLTDRMIGGVTTIAAHSKSCKSILE